MLSVEEALSAVLSAATRTAPRAATAVPLPDALSLVFAEDVRAPDPLPPFRASIKDGYAVVAFDGPGEYPVIMESRAGDDALAVVVAPGTVAYVTTGGPIPKGANAVVQVEDTEQVAGAADMPKRVRILVRATEGQDIRPVLLGDVIETLSLFWTEASGMLTPPKETAIGYALVVGVPILDIMAMRGHLVVRGGAENEAVLSSLGA